MSCTGVDIVKECLNGPSHGRSSDLRGKALSGMLRNDCEETLIHAAEVLR